MKKTAADIKSAAVFLSFFLYFSILSPFSLCLYFYISRFFIAGGKAYFRPIKIRPQKTLWLPHIRLPQKKYLTKKQKNDSNNQI